jgi:hypothetical protein
MLIRCLHERAGGTDVEFGNRVDPDYRLYHFTSGADGFHVAEVGDELDAQTLLAIPSAYVQHGPVDKAAVKAAAKAKREADEAAAKEEAEKTAFLDELDRAGLEAFADERGVKLDTGHDDEQVRNYLKGMILSKG